MNYPEYTNLNLPDISKQILTFWNAENIFQESILSRSETNQFTFYEGPPSANGLPGIHHVMARTIKDIFCRFKTLKGYRVERKGGWDTHGLPIEIAVEKSLGITKDDIGKKISIEDYNLACKKEVLKYTDLWNELTEKMGYWVDLENPYITYKTPYIETLWWLLKELDKKGLIYKGYTVQPFSPAAGTGLSSHELNQPGTYRMVKDTSIVAQFKIIKNDASTHLFSNSFNQNHPVYFLAWTTTPWTLPSNCALAVGKDIIYAKIKTFNPYTYLPEEVILAEALIPVYFSEKAKDLPFEDYKGGDKPIPWSKLEYFKGERLLGIRYEQLMPYVVNEDLMRHAFQVIPADFVTTEEGTGIVHTASIFGADDFRVCKENGIPSVMGKDSSGNEVPLVDKQGKFTKEVVDFAGRYVKAEYESEETLSDPSYKSTDVLISILLKEENKAFKVEKYEHSYPHCWRTDKPILYYPLDSWFIKTTAYKEKLVELNKTIHWKPASTGSGRFGNWLENLVDWNLSRSRFWGTPLPIWRSLDGLDQIFIGALIELEECLIFSLNSNLLNPAEQIKDEAILSKLKAGILDLHKPFVDDIVLISQGGKKLFREPDLIDVWFDSGAMPYAQWHYPFENKDKFALHFPADFIAEGVDQTRGWFFTLHAISVLVFGKISYKNVISNGLVLDKNGNKMSKRLGNAIDPFKTLKDYGADATRWYMISNAAPWENLKFNLDGIEEVSRKFFGTLYNTYSFFALYANIDGFDPELSAEKNVLGNLIEEMNASRVQTIMQPESDPNELDAWILSLLNSLIQKVDGALDEYEPTKAVRALEEFVDNHLSNWYIRLSRRRFWKGTMTVDKYTAYQTLYECLNTLSILISPFAPFFSDWLYRNLRGIHMNSMGYDTSKKLPEGTKVSVHLQDFPNPKLNKINKDLEEQMELAQIISSMVLSLRKKVEIKVRQPLKKILIIDKHKDLQKKIEKVYDLILSETNIKSIEFIEDTTGFLVNKIKPNYKKLGPKTGKKMKAVAVKIESLGQEDINYLEKTGFIFLDIEEETFRIALEDVDIIGEDIPGWQVNTLGKLTVALDTLIDDSLLKEGLAREFINRIQNIRKEKGFLVTDTISVVMENSPFMEQAINENKPYICTEILGSKLEWTKAFTEYDDANEIDIEGNIFNIRIIKNDGGQRKD